MPPPVQLPPPATISTHSLGDAVRSTGRWLFGADGLHFRDILDLVNPLQHIPGISQIYRRLTGDEIKPAMELAGGALFGGPIGVAFAAVGLVAQAGAESVVASVQATKVAAMNTASTAQGGHWKLNTALAKAPAGTVVGSRAPPLAAAISSDTPAGIARRGGWMLTAAYGQLDAQRALARLHETA